MFEQNEMKMLKDRSYDKNLEDYYIFQFFEQDYIFSFIKFLDKLVSSDYHSI